MLSVKKIVIGSICFAIILVAVFGGKYMYSLQRYKSIISDIKIDSVDLSKLADGKYTGSCDAVFVGAKVVVTVNAHKITDVDLINHKNEKGKLAEGIPAKVMEAQSLEVDTISGATNSSKVILKAIENALKSDKE
ncbi:MAG: FMN-binding protein [Ruminiclostridium sp.]